MQDFLCTPSRNAVIVCVAIASTCSYPGPLPAKFMHAWRHRLRPTTGIARRYLEDRAREQGEPEVHLSEIRRASR